MPYYLSKQRNALSILIIKLYLVPAFFLSSFIYINNLLKLQRIISFACVSTGIMYSIIEMYLYRIMEAMMYFRTPEDHVVRVMNKDTVYMY